MNFNEAISYLDNLKLFGIKLGLDRTRAVAAKLGSPQEKFRSVHVAGTNGKGSVSAMTAAILRKAGYKTGLYLSPYVFSFGERMQMNGEMIPEQTFADITERVKAAAEEAEAEGLGCITEFEAKTLSAFTYYADSGADFAVIEVGMGGRLDATNIITPAVSVITHISLDHTEYLGGTVAEIAGEKAGIIKPGVPVVTSSANPEALSVIRAKAAESGSAFIHAVPEGKTLRTPRGDVKLEPALPGAFQIENAAAAAAAALAALPDIDIEIIEEGIRDAGLPGRMQYIHHNPAVVLDGAHNPGAAAAVRNTLKETEYDKLILVCGMLKTHSAEDFLSVLAPMAEKVIAVQSGNPKARPAGEIKKIAESLGVPAEEIPDVNDALSAATKQAGKKDLILVTGSFYTVAEVKPDIGD
ncbi:MAG: bifunctional folylpolyglutamate synthase/dihydrofolate synthase [Abditibacteriota bacterium]|nr:bifunctional folylpolyglutamate synthase/dihydrofolate synthase [Abditibacteriota bacterium]